MIDMYIGLTLAANLIISLIMVFGFMVYYIQAPKGQLLTTTIVMSIFGILFSSIVVFLLLSFLYHIAPALFTMFGLENIVQDNGITINIPYAYGISLAINTLVWILNIIGQLYVGRLLLNWFAKKSHRIYDLSNLWRAIIYGNIAGIFVSSIVSYAIMYYRPVKNV